jgi:hypothetical protein
MLEGGGWGRGRSYTVVIGVVMMRVEGGEREELHSGYWGCDDEILELFGL